ncbi:Lectin-domain containing receptor kinase A4.2 [Hordeum vulgare]|nr:Lectin-domain containing receptor kinase A4.2 [Hordeum vulgare]KAI4997004.1 hypothetical protein ZWY2020_052346 [Hordeum vulgare]
MQTPANKSVGTVTTSDNRVVAIEFDTYLNDGFDATGSHMGIDINSIISGAYTNATVLLPRALGIFRWPAVVVLGPSSASCAPPVAGLDGPPPPTSCAPSALCPQPHLLNH